jgi:asparagine synthase (glutamine-hydrolysing)
MDMVGSDGSLLSLYLGRRRALSNAQMREAGLGPVMAGLNGDYVDPVRADSVRVPEDDPVAAVSILESQFYLNNTLLRDGDCYGMSQSLEIRVPFLDKRVIELMYRIPGKVRLPNGKADKHLLRKTVATEFGPGVLGQRKKGFMLPIGKWLMGPLREVCLDSLEYLKASGYVERRGVDSVWETFYRQPESPIWSRVWEMCVLGYYLHSHARRGSAQPALSVQRAV